MTATRLDPQALAEACAEAMWAEDHASRGLGMGIVRVAPGEAEIAMAVEPRMANGHGICHGGFIFTLADSAFAFACNTYDQRTVAQRPSQPLALQAADLVGGGALDRLQQLGRRGLAQAAGGRGIHGVVSSGCGTSWPPTTRDRPRKAAIARPSSSNTSTS